MASKWTTSKALKAINNARSDISKRKDEDDFSYEPWETGTAEEQAAQYEAFNQRIEQYKQNGGLTEAEKARRDAVRANTEAEQTRQIQEQQASNAALQNALTTGSLDSYKAYKNATKDQQSALENIYTAQNQTLTGYDRFMGSKTGTGSAGKLANQFKTDYGVSDDEYNSLMSGYKAYRSSQAANALSSYSDISSEQKKALEKIRSLKTDGTANNTTVSGGDRYSGYKTQEASTHGTIAQALKDRISGKTKKDKEEAESLKDQFKQKYGVDDATYSAWQAKYDEDQTKREEEAAAHKEGVRTQSQEMEYANRKFSNVTSGRGGSTWDQRTQALKQEIYDYLDQEDAAQTAEAMQYAETASNISNDGGKAQRQKLAEVKAAIQSKYNLSDEEFEDLKYYGQELYDYENRKKQQQEAYENVHQDSTLKNIAGGIKNTASALVLNPYGGLGAIGETLKYNSGAYRDKQSPINVNSAAFAASNATSDYQGTTQQALNDKNKILGVLYGAGMSAAESAETSTLGGATGNRVLASALSLAPFAANAYGNSLSENIGNDQRQSKAFENALTSATIETVTEIASADKFWDSFKNHNAKARNRIIDFLVSSGIEGSEEVVGGIADKFMDAVVNGQNSEYNQNVRSYMMSGMSENEAKKQATKDAIKEIAESFVTGALSGAMGAGIATAAGYANDVNMANNLFDGYTSKDYAEWADGLDTDPASYKNESAAQSAQKAKELATKMSQEQTPSKKEKLQLFEYYQDMQNVEAEAAAEEQEDIDRQKRWDSFTDKARSIFGRNETNAEEDIQEERTTDSAQESISAISNVPEEYRSEQNSTTYNDAYRQIQSATTQEELNEAIQTAKNSEEISWEDYEKLEQTAGSYAASKNNLDLEQAKVSKEDAYNAGYSGEEIGNVSADLQIAYNDGMKQAASDRAAQKAHNEELVNRAAEKQTNPGLGEIITSNYKDGMNARTYNEVMASAINAGRTGMSFEEYSKENGMSLAIVGEDLAKTAYSAGQQVAIEEGLKEAARSLGEKTNVQAFGTGTFTDARTDKTENFQGAGVIEAMARMTGLDIVLTDQNFGTDDNGYYRSSNSTIYLNSNQADRVASTLFHEVGEFSSVWNQNEYASVVNDIMQASQTALGSREFNRLRQKYVDAYHGETNKTDADIDKEMANDLLYQFIGNEKGMNKLMDQIDQNHGYKEAKSIKQRLADWVGHMVESIKSFISQLRPNSYQYKMATTNLQNYEELQNAIVKSIANAEQAYSDAKAAREEASEAKAVGLDDNGSRTAGEEAGKRKSINIIPDTINEDIERNIQNFGKMKSVVDVPNNVFQRGEKKLSEQVRDYFLENSDNGIVYGNVIGDVDIVSGIKSDIAHGVGRMKAMAFHAVPDTIRKGVIVDYQKNRKQRGYDSLLIAAPIRIENENGGYEDAIEIVAINRSNTDMQRFYFHEAFIINEDESLFKNGRPNRSLPVNDSSSSVYSISRRLIASNENVRAKRSSRNIDSEDRELTTGQQKYFASSKLRDADGKLKVMYHGSTNAGFTTFDPQYSDDGISLFFTDSPRVAESYSGSDEEWRPDKHYSFDELSGMVDGYFAGDLQLIQNGDKTGLITVDGDVLYEGDLNGARDAFFDEIAEVPYDRGAANYKVYLNLENPYEFDANGRDWDELTEPRYASDVQHEYERLNVSHDAATDRYSLIGTDVSGNKETVFENKTLSEIEEEYGENLREFMADTYYYKRSGTSVETSTYSDVGFDGEWSLMNSHLTTREIADYAKKNGYDGVIFKNIVDMGTYRRGHEASTVAIAFSSDQVKSVDNENPTTYADFRRAIGIDDTWNDDYDWTAEESKIQSGLAEALRSGNEILKGAEVNEANIRRIARQLKNQYGSRISVDELAENLTKVFAYAQKQDYINYNDLATVISEVASPMIEQSTAKTSAQEFKAFKQALQSYTFRLDESQQKEVISAFGSWGAFRKALPGVKFTRDGSGISLDSVWDTLCEESGYVLEQGITSSDEPLALVDAYNSMKPTYQNAFGEDAQNAAQDAAMEIVSKYYGYAAQQEKNALKKKQKEDLENLSKKIAQTNAEMRKQLQQKYNERLEKEIAKVKKESKPEKVSVQVARLRARTAKTVSSLREAQRRKEELRYLNKTAAQLVDWVTDPTDKNHIPKLLQTPVLQLMTSLDFVPQTVRETADGKYSIRILESRTMNEDGSYSYKWRTITADTVQGAVEQYKEAMNKFGLGSKQNRTWQENMEALHDLYQQNEEDDWYEKSELKQGLDKNLGEQLGEILRNNKGMMSIAELSSSELRVINDVMKNVMHAVRQVNRMYSQPSQQVSDVAHMVMDRANSGGVHGRQKHGKRMTGLIDTFTLDHAAPVVYFHGVFGTDGIDPITKTMIKAQNQKARDVRQAQEYMGDVIEKAGMDKDSFQKAVEKWMYNATSKDHNTRNFYGLELTQTQIMSLYELMKRPDAQQHKAGGFIADETGRKSNGQKTIVHLTDEQIRTITDTLSEEQKKLADAMQWYLANECAKQGNETAMQLYGYEKYLDEHYFPMTTDSNTIATRDSNVTTGAINAIKNSGFTKKITPNANNALVLKDIFTVYADHVSQMATYHAWAAPLQDMIRFFNYHDQTTDENGFISRDSVKNAIDYFYGASGQEYFVKLLSSINAKEKSNFVGGKFYEALTGNAKAAAVMGNLRVVIQQPTAFMRAGEMISYKYLKDGLEFKYAKEAAELRDRTSDVFWLKNQGNIDGYITQGMVSTITGVQTFKEKVNEKAGWAAGKADEVTWAAMYRAVYAEQVDKLGKNKIGTKVFEDAVNDRYSEIMLRTQVYDGTITRSQFMRSTEMANKMASAFMAEPVKTYNIVLWHMMDLMQASTGEAKKKAMKGLVRAGWVLTLTNAANAVAQSFWDAFRNAGSADDEDKDFLQRFLDALGLGEPEGEDEDTIWDAIKRFAGGNFVDNMDLLSNIPLVADYWDAVKSGISTSLLGESSYTSDSDLSMSGVSNFFKAVKAVVNPSDKMTAYGQFAAVARAFSDLTGLPVYAVQRDAVAIYNTLIGKTMEGAPLLQKTTKYSESQQAKLDVYSEALEGGDYKQAIEDAYNAGNSYESIRNSISKQCKEQYLELKKTSPSEATQMKNRLAQMYVYLAGKTGTYKDKTDAEKLKIYTKNIEKWSESEEEDAEE